MRFSLRDAESRVLEDNAESSVSVSRGSQRVSCRETQVIKSSSSSVIISHHHQSSISVIMQSSIIINHHHIISHSSLHQSFINDCHSSLHHSLFIIIIRFWSRDSHHLVNILMIIVSSNISLLNALIGVSESPLPLGIAALPSLGLLPPKSTQRGPEVLLIWLWSESMRVRRFPFKIFSSAI